MYSNYYMNPHYGDVPYFVLRIASTVTSFGKKPYTQTISQDLNLYAMYP